ncbi:MAG: hypothetical protein JW969_09570 [Spirochaetales bacterium]|nr:hypothetical protein [Spirochaetales bacterium]
MKKFSRYLCYVTVFFILSGAFSQYLCSETIWNESFTNNKNGWYTDDFIKVSKGKYVYYNPANDCSAWRTDKLADFEMAADARWVKGAQDLGYGFVFRLADRQHFYIFFIAANGFYTLGKVDGAYTALVKWTASPSIHKKTNNKISIKCSGDRIQGYANLAMLFDIRDASFTEGGYGFFVSKNIYIEFDNLLVKTLAAEKTSAALSYKGRVTTFGKKEVANFEIDVFQILDVENFIITPVTTLKTDSQGYFSLPCEKGKAYYLKPRQDKKAQYTKIIDTNISPEDKEIEIRIPNGGIK